MTSSLTFYGAVHTVTGSRFLVEQHGARVLVDAGLYQGLRELRRRNWDPFPVDPSSLDAVVLTHAHLDHSGYLPALVRDGFTGRIVCTPETAALAEIVLRDSAHLQEEDAAYANELGFSKHRPALPLYDEGDVVKALPLFAPVDYERSTGLAGRLAVTLRPAGHILGSATALIEAGDGRVQFSGDLGRPFHPLLEPPAPPGDAHSLVVESTYGDRTHPRHPDDHVLAEAITRTVNRGGSVLIPAFAVDRTELVLMRLHRLRAEGRVPSVPVYVDSPMALRTLEVYRLALRRPGAMTRAGLTPQDLDPGDLHQVGDASGSALINRPEYPSIIVSASGMASGGRVVHHLRHQLPDPRNTVVLTGFQAEGTRGRQLLDGAREVKVHGHYVPVRAEIVRDDTFSVHADGDEIVEWIGRASELPRTVYVVHGEEAAAQTLARRIEREYDVCAVVPTWGERVLLD